MQGGGPGARGLNLLRRHVDGRVVNLGGKNSVSVRPGDTLIIQTPGGGGYGESRDAVSVDAAGETEGVSLNTPHQALKSGGSLLQYISLQETA